MRNTDEARRHVLRAIRDNLAASSAYESRRSTHERAVLPIFTAGPSSYPRADRSGDAALQFVERVSAVGGSCTIVRGETQAAQAVARIIGDARARVTVASDAPLVRRVLSHAADHSLTWRTIDEVSRQELFACDVGVTTAQHGITETGTLVLQSADEKHRLLSLVPPVHVALLPVSRLCESLADALERVRAVGPSGILASRTITFITGPSRTSDIELTLTIGVHGPQSLHVILLQE